MEPELKRLRLEYLGVVPHAVAYARQLELVAQRKHGAGDDTLLICEHPHVITKGRRREADANILAPGDIPVVELERGGDVTYHGPGQLVAYPIIALDAAAGERDLHRYLRALEGAVISTVRALALPADREAGKTGVWTTTVAGERKKLCSIGIACRSWVCFHGLALNVSTDLAYFARINPCGFDAGVMTTLQVEAAPRGLPLPGMEQVAHELTRQLAVSLHRCLV